MEILTWKWNRLIKNKNNHIPMNKKMAMYQRVGNKVLSSTAQTLTSSKTGMPS
jgi:hypothetical protein